MTQRMRMTVLAAAVAVLVSLAWVAPAGQVTYQPVGKALDKVAVVLHVKVTDIRRSKTIMILPDGSDGPTLATHVSYRCEVRGVVCGTWRAGAKTAAVRHTWGIPVIYDKDGNAVGTVSPLLPGTGIEHRLTEGQEVLMCLAPETNQDPVLIRAEPVERREAVLEAYNRLLRVREASSPGPAGR